LPDALRGERADFYRLMDDPEEALSFSRGQHAGSLGPAVVLARTVDLKGARRLLDVGGVAAPSASPSVSGSRG
jgi:2-hydroxy-4-(methylsulfanyl)butanoate S-methyltransferase